MMEIVESLEFDKAEKLLLAQKNQEFDAASQYQMYLWRKHKHEKKKMVAAQLVKKEPPTPPGTLICPKVCLPAHCQRLRVLELSLSATR